MSAVDQNVGRHIFESCIKSHLKELGQKAVVLVTHQLQYLSQCDFVAMVKNGTISKYGTYKSLYDTDVEFRDMIDNHVASGEDGDEVDDHHVDDPTAPSGDPNSPATVQIESPSYPAATDTVRSMKELIEMNSLSVRDRNQLTVHSVKFLEGIDEDKMRSMSERRQLEMIHGGNTSHDISEIIKRNEATVHSFVEFARDNDISLDETNDEEDGVKKEPAPPKLIQDDTSYERMGFVNVRCITLGGLGTFLTQPCSTCNTLLSARAQFSHLLCVDFSSSSTLFVLDLITGFDCGRQTP